MGGGADNEEDSNPPRVEDVTDESKENKKESDTKPDTKPRHIELVTDDSKENKNGENGTEPKPSPVLTNGKGWDGKLRVPGRASLANPEALSDPEYSDEDNVVQGEQIQADEGTSPSRLLRQRQLHLCIPPLKNTQPNS